MDFVKTPRAFAAMMRTERLRQGITQKEIAEKSGMSYRWVQEFEAGKLDPSLTGALSIARSLGFEVGVQRSVSHPVIDQLFEAL